LRLHFNFKTFARASKIKQFLQLVGEVLKVELDNDISTIKGAPAIFHKTVV